jgi:hypothetical protein
MILITKLEKSIAKRSLVVLVLMALAALFFMNDRFTVLAGIILGSLLSYIRFHALVTSFLRILSGKTGSPVLGACIWYIVGLLIVVPVLIVSLLCSKSMFFGMAAGVLLVPLTLTLLGMTGKLGSDIYTVG